MKLIDKDAVLAEIERKRDAALTRQHNLEAIGQVTVLNETLARELSRIISFIDTLEVKEVDYERELSKYVSNGIHRFFPNVDDDYCKMDSVTWQDYVIETAKHFFELGLKAQKGE